MTEGAHELAKPIHGAEREFIAYAIRMRAKSLANSKKSTIFLKIQKYFLWIIARTGILTQWLAYAYICAYHPRPCVYAK